VLPSLGGSPQPSPSLFCAGKWLLHLQVCSVHAPVQPWLGKSSVCCLLVAVSQAPVPQLRSPLGLVQLAGSEHTS